MTIVDVNCFVGSYPWRDIGPAEPHALIGEMRRTGVSTAWISNLTAMFWRNPAAGNPRLYAIQAAHPQLRPIGSIHPGLPHWHQDLDDALDARCPAVRCDPGCYGLAADGNELTMLAQACSESNVPLMMAVRLEDVRQRHPHDSSADLAASAVRHLIRRTPDLRLIITHADRDFVEQVHFGLTPAESSRIVWDICWIWGPPEDQLALLIETIGADRFVFGSAMPMRLPDVPVARIELLDVDESVREALRHGNIERFRQALSPEP